ncbi:MAG: hypothetical protein ABI178_13920 [Rhodanobacter sp.]
MVTRKPWPTTCSTSFFQSRVIASHDDLWYRELGRKDYENGNPAVAMRLFLHAARYADKPSQAIIATMYWNGDGVEQSRPLAYAWMDLAANHGYPKLLVQRELLEGAGAGRARAGPAARARDLR